MDDTPEIYFVEEDERNAVPLPLPQPRRPATRRPIPIMGRRPGPVATRPYPYPYPSTGTHWWPAGTTPPGYYQAPQPQPTVIVHQPQPRSWAGMSTGELIEAGAALLAAIQPLPGAPSSTGHGETDLENLVTYQGALAQHAKRDEQLRTLGSLLGKFLNANHK